MPIIIAIIAVLCILTLGAVLLAMKNSEPWHYCPECFQYWHPDGTYCYQRPETYNVALLVCDRCARRLESSRSTPTPPLGHPSSAKRPAALTTRVPSADGAAGSSF